ncbi:hypothetical protein, partial [Segatella oris]|uniref:hypothetical protein n=1 Tax=Segatella oris TaxID=28135 RepID=UPI001C306621
GLELAEPLPASPKEGRADLKSLPLPLPRRGEPTCGAITTVLWLSKPQRPLNHNKKSRFYMTNEQ